MDSLPEVSTVSGSSARGADLAGLEGLAGDRGGDCSGRPGDPACAKGLPAAGVDEETLRGDPVLEDEPATGPPDVSRLEVLFGSGLAVGDLEAAFLDCIEVTASGGMATMSAHSSGVSGLRLRPSFWSNE